MFILCLWRKVILKNILVFSILVFSNLLVFISHRQTDIQQLIEDDLSNIILFSGITKFYGYLIISILVSLFSLFLKSYFNPFIEVYLLYFQRFGFYFLINLISISSVYLVLRVYGYSRLSLLFYLIISSLILYYSDKSWISSTFCRHIWIYLFLQKIYLG